MIADPAERGRRLAAFHIAVSPRLWNDLLEGGALPAERVTDATALEQARQEWDCFALYACVRGLVAAGGFNVETGAAIDALHEHVLAAWLVEDGDLERFDVRRGRVAERYAEYGAIGQQGGAAGAGSVGTRLGAAAGRHLVGGGEPSSELAELVGGLHETLVEGAAEAVRRDA